VPKRKHDFFDVMESRSRKSKKNPSEGYPEQLAADLQSAAQTAKTIQHSQPERKTQVGTQVGTQIDPLTDLLTDQQIGTQVGRPSARYTQRTTSIPTCVPTCESVFLTERQAALYLCLKRLEGRPTNLPKIADITRLSQNTLKKCLSKLTKTGVISHHGFCKIGNMSGFRASITSKHISVKNPSDSLLQHVLSIEPSRLALAHDLPEYPAADLPEYPAENTVRSSFSIEKTTTYGKCEDEKCADPFMARPEMGYWREKGLTEKQISTWVEMTGIKREILLQCLDHCRFEMVELGMEASKPVRDVRAYFYRVIDKAGYYPSAKEYKPFEEIQLDREKAIIAEREGRLTELREIQEKKKAQELEIRFLEMMSDPKCELYKQCWNHVNAFEKKKGGGTLERAMQLALGEIMEQAEDSSLNGPTG